MTSTLEWVKFTNFGNPQHILNIFNNYLKDCFVRKCLERTPQHSHKLL